MRKQIMIGAFIGLILLQIAVPMSMIVKREMTLAYGTAFKFQIAPVDPYDPFRGRYVSFRVNIKVPNSDGLDLKYGQQVFAQLFVDENGFAQVSKISLRKPQDGTYVVATVSHILGSDSTISLPIDRYYMEEKAAPRAEQVYWQKRAHDKKDAHILVKVKDDCLVIEGLYIDDKRIEDIVKEKSL